jgi:hypothetical protein
MHQRAAIGEAGAGAYWFTPRRSGNCRCRRSRVQSPRMMQNAHATLSPARRQPLWPWLVMPLAILALFALLHTIRQSGGGLGPDSIEVGGP